MEDCSEVMLRQICCTCLSVHRKLTRLCKLKDGINNLFFLLSYDTEAYNAMFSKEATQLFVCWECIALMQRMCRFRDRVCAAQKHLLDIVDGRIDVKLQKSLSTLTWFHRNGYDICISNQTIEDFIDCGPDVDNIKSECDIYMLESGNSLNESINEFENENIEEIKVSENKLEIKPLAVKRKFKKVSSMKRGSVRKIFKTEEVVIKEEGYSRIKMSDEEMLERNKEKKLHENYINALNKCESCVEAFKDKNELEVHNARLHVQKPKYIQCDICLVYIKFWWLPEHKNEHYLKYQCHFCEQVFYHQLDILTHLKTVHSMKNILGSGIMRKLKRKAMLTNPVLVQPKNENLDNCQTESHQTHTLVPYKCPECNKYFDNTYLRYKHILKTHREGHRCATCGKTFAFKNTLNKHEQIHGDPQPREQCAICGKMVRADRVKFHARIHGERKSFECISCDKRFVSHDSYEKHLKYSRSHAVRDVHKYKCTMCEKGFRTVRELNDHVNYNHMGKTQHKCPICHKALATRRCVTRHVSRAHHGIKEKSGDKILCQTCGKAFRDKKSLREHELIHTGEKPLSCDMCGRMFRQSACLYTHKRRVHKVAPKRLHVRHAGQDDGQVEMNVLQKSINTEIK